jgi:selenocysteine lyase/cysteine desulfurase
MTPSVAEHFPALRSGFSYLDHASGAQAPGVMPEGAVRVSLLHDNTPRDVDRLLAGLDSLP